jgi:hypothetical protein
MNRNFVNFRAVFHDLTDEVLRSSGSFLKDHLSNWFEQVDETPGVGPLIRSLEANLDFEQWKTEREESIQSMAGSGELRWPKGREHRLGMQLQLFRRIAEDRLDAFDFSSNYMGRGADLDEQISLFTDQVFRPMARDLRRFLEERLAEAREDEFPASDRIVRLDHNSARYKDAMDALEALERVLKEANDYPDAEDKDQKIAEVSAARRLFQSVRVRVGAVVSLLGTGLVYLATKFATTGIGEAAKYAWDQIGHLIGTMPKIW